VAPRTIRRLVLVVFVAGIAGMIVGSIADNNGVAITFGLITATAAVGLILVTAVAGPEAFGRAAARPRPQVDDAVRAGDELEQQVARLVEAGAEERQVRELVRRAVAFGRAVPD
jgi:UPF0716 family protein affecting phage T7 exclusion